MHEVDASFFPLAFVHPLLRQPIGQWMKDMSAGILATRAYFRKKLASPFGHYTQVSTQVQLAATCEPVWPGLSSEDVFSYMSENTALAVLPGFSSSGGSFS